MTIEEIRAKKAELESKVFDLFYEFEEQTGLVISDVNYERKELDDLNSLRKFGVILTL